MAHVETALKPNAPAISRLGRLSDRSTNGFYPIGFIFLFGGISAILFIIAILCFFADDVPGPGEEINGVASAVFVLPTLWFGLGALYDYAKLPGTIKPSSRLNEFLAAYEALSVEDRKDLRSVYSDAFRWEEAKLNGYDSPMFDATMMLNNLLKEQENQRLQIVRSGVSEDSLRLIADKLSVTKQVNDELKHLY